MSLLIIDDDDVFRRHVQRIIAVDVRGCATAADGLAEASTWKPHVILLDTYLNDGDAVDLTPRLKACSPRSEIIVCSAYYSEEIGRMVIAEGAFSFVEKGDDALLLDLFRAACFRAEDRRSRGRFRHR